jgi:hypothetical protein
MSFSVLLGELKKNKKLVNPLILFFVRKEKVSKKNHVLKNRRKRKEKSGDSFRDIIRKKKKICQ